METPPAIATASLWATFEFDAEKIMEIESNKGESKLFQFSNPIASPNPLTILLPMLQILYVSLEALQCTKRQRIFLCSKI